MKISWLFKIDDTYYWSTKAVTFGSTNYTAKILPDSFDGISMRWDVSRQGLITPSDLSFEIENTDGVLSRSDLEGDYCTIILVTDDSESRRWKFKIQSATEYYGKMGVYCIDILQDILQGEYPNTPHPREVFPSEMHEVDENDTYRIPVIFGKAFIPLMLVYRQSDSTAYYTLGKNETYTITKIMDPPSLGKTLWTSAEYDFNQQEESGYKIADFEVFYDPETETYSDGTWSSSANPLVEYKVSTDNDSLNPADVLDWLLQEWGVASADIDSTTWGTAETTFSTQSLTWQGGFYQSQMRETILNNLLTQCDSNLYISDKIELHPFSNTPQETFDTSKTIKGSFSVSKASNNYYDSGRVRWVKSGTPQSELSGKAIVPIENGGSTNNPSGEIFKAGFISSAVIAQKLGIMHFQRK